MKQTEYLKRTAELLAEQQKLKSEYVAERNNLIQYYKDKTDALERAKKKDLDTLHDAYITQQQNREQEKLRLKIEYYEAMEESPNTD